ncbi:putative ste ste11 protein kinase [Diaporthe ampelina]|uniref:Putative ste ste11 protein kinase n=1 Tax=Diaporthe ampelina TaxID=1214573 RepID=A0A0G2HSN2_9PEZI|nr:putative ste ste11 protein kinase [Diaporthe ampelina]
MPNVISYLGCQLKEGRIFVLTEYLPGGTLRDLIRNYGAVPQPLARSILRQAVLGLQQLHEQGIAPMFLELDNVLMDNVGSVKVEAPLLDAATTGTGKALLPTTLAPPPELLLGQQDVRKADVWLLGVMAAQLLTGDCSLADGTSDGPVATRTKEAQGSSALGLLIPGRVAGRFDGRASDLIRQCLCMDTNHRPSVSDLLEHPFLNGSD